MSHAPRRLIRFVHAAMLGAVMGWLSLGAAHAEPGDELRETLAELRGTEARKRQIDQDSERLARELALLQEEIIRLAETVERHESEMGALEDKIGALNAEREEKRTALTGHEQELSEVLGSIIRLSHTPPEALIVMEGGIDDTMRTAQVLGLVTENLHARADGMRTELADLDLLESRILAHHKELGTRKAALVKQQQAANRKITERSTLQDRLFGEQKQEATRLADLSKRSTSLQELVTTLTARQREEDAKPAAPQPKAIALRSFENARGRLKLPVSGTLTTRFGERKGHNDTSRGVIISTRNGAQVTSPFDGEVVYAGHFMEYGRMVILRHKGGYHSLLAGLTQVNCAPGERLREGEPVGTMGTAEGKTLGNRLYLELRKDSRPVDPSLWFKGLSRLAER